LQATQPHYNTVSKPLSTSDFIAYHINSYHYYAKDLSSSFFRSSARLPLILICLDDAINGHLRLVKHYPYLAWAAI